MQRKQITLRDARPTSEEGLVFDRYLDTAAEGFFRLMLGRRSSDIIAAAFTRPDHDLSYQNVSFADCDGEVVGMASGYPGERQHQSCLKALRQAAGRWNFRMRVSSLLAAPLLRVLDSITAGDYYLQAIAVDAELRGKGLGSILIESIEEKARASGASRLALHVSAKNETARQFYERRGFSVESQWPKRLAIPGLRLYCMVKSLS